MARQISVVTPENIPLEMELAGLGTRFGAVFVDLITQGLCIGVGAALIGLFALIAPGYSIIEGLVTIWAFLVGTGYFLFFEGVWNGQTPGKRLFRLRVVRDGGYPVNFFAVAARNLVRIADFFPLFYGAGSLAVFFSPQYKRLGDMVAGSVVVKEQEIPPLHVVLDGAGKRGGGTLPPGVRHPSDVLTPDELDLLRRFAVRRWGMVPDDAERLAYRLVVPLVPRLGITFLPGAAPRYSDLASVLVAAADAREAELDQAA